MSILEKNPSVTFDEISKAEERLAPYLPSTPLVYNAWLSHIYGCHVYLKLENVQPIGSFKIRGATHKVLKLSEAEKKKGIVAASAGNHAQGVAWAADKLGVRATVVMPKLAPIIKVQNTTKLGASVKLVGDTYDEAFSYAEKLAEEKKLAFVHAYHDSDVMAGQGVVGLEILKQLPKTDFVVGGVGGGGLMAAVGTVFRELRPSAKVYGCQAKGASPMVKAFQDDKPVTLDRLKTFADGVAVLKAYPAMLKLLKAAVDDILVVGDDEIAAAVLSLMEKAKTVAEGAGALPLAALEQLRDQIAEKNVVLIVSGGNIDVNLLSRIIDLGLVRTGRRIRVNVILDDYPGALAKLTALLAEEGVNILQVTHDRDKPSSQVKQVDVGLTLETRGPDHVKQVLDRLKEEVRKVELI